MIRIELQGITKKYGKDVLFSGVDLMLESSNSYALLGANGSGKSTLLQVLATYISPTAGQVMYWEHGQQVANERIYTLLSLCAPYLELIEEFTLHEFLHYHARSKPVFISVQEMIDRMGLGHSTHKYLKAFSSGMKQRVKLAQAIFSNVPVLLLDEPCTNLDLAGVDWYHAMMQEFGNQRIILVASNDEKEYSMCQQHIQLSNFKPS